MQRRGFLQACLALAAAPAIVRADSLMRIVPRDAVIVGANGIELVGLGGLVRVMKAHDIVTDCMIMRLDTTNGVEQHHVDIWLPNMDAIDWRRHVDPALEVLKNHVKAKHGGFEGFRAPPPIAGVDCEVI